jgi:hypothetical protein
MTTITEKKSEFGFIFGFVIVVLVLVAIRAKDAPFLSGALVIVAIGILLGLISWWRKPAPSLRISPSEIVYGRLDQPGMRIRRDASPTGRLEFRMGFKRSGWFLVLVDATTPQSLSMLGFDMNEVGRACVEHGWTFD